LCERIFIHKKLRKKPNYISVPNGPWYEWSTRGTNSLVIVRQTINKFNNNNDDDDNNNKIML